MRRVVRRRKRRAAARVAQETRPSFAGETGGPAPASAETRPSFAGETDGLAPASEGADPTRFERWLATQTGTRTAATAGAVAILAVGAVAAWPILRVDPLPPYAATVVPVEALTPTAAPPGTATAAPPLAILQRMRQTDPALRRLELRRTSIRPRTGELAEFAVQAGEPTDIRAMVTTRGGDLVRIVVEGHFAAGLHTFAWDGRDSVGQAAVPGIYTLQVTTDRWGEQRKVQVLP